MELLYLEMLQKSIKPEEKGVINIIDASASFCSVDKLGRTVKLLKSGIVIITFIIIKYYY